jgi:hypothetical protein
MKKIYVGGCFDDYLEVRNIQNIFVSNGFEITYDWTITPTKKKNETNFL